MNVPVLFCIFNRLDTVKKTFMPVKKARPKKLYIASDGPRPDSAGEAAQVAAVREYILSQIDWDCEVQTLFREKNIGCEMALYGAIKWMFEKEEMGIILEDDILVSDTFFKFMEKMLYKFKDDKKVSMISGFNMLKKISNYDYEFVPMVQTLGFAMYKNVVDMYEFDSKNSVFGDYEKRKMYKKYFGSDLGKGMYQFFKPAHEWCIELITLCLSLNSKGYRSIVPTHSLTTHIPSIGLHFVNNREFYIPLADFNLDNLSEPLNTRFNKKFSRLYFASLVYRHMFNTYGFETDIKKLQADTKDLKCQVAPLKLKLQLLPFHRKDKRDERLLRAAQIDRLIEYNTSFYNLLKRYPDWPSLIQRPVQD